MKRIILINLILFGFAFNALAQDIKPAVGFESKFIALGEVVHGEKKTGIFRFTNHLDEPLIIELVSSCECTSLEWTRGPILPGQKGEVNFVFDSAQKEKSEVIDVDIYFENSDPVSGDPMFEIVQYEFILVKE